MSSNERVSFSFSCLLVGGEGRTKEASESGLLFEIWIDSSSKQAGSRQARWVDGLVGWYVALKASHTLSLYFSTNHWQLEVSFPHSISLSVRQAGKQAVKYCDAVAAAAFHPVILLRFYSYNHSLTTHSALQPLAILFCPIFEFRDMSPQPPPLAQHPYLSHWRPTNLRKLAFQLFSSWLVSTD